MGAVGDLLIVGVGVAVAGGCYYIVNYTSLLSGSGGGLFDGTGNGAAHPGADGESTCKEFTGAELTSAGVDTPDASLGGKIGYAGIMFGGAFGLLAGSSIGKWIGTEVDKNKRYMVCVNNETGKVTSIDKIKKSSTEDVGAKMHSGVATLPSSSGAPADPNEIVGYTKPSKITTGGQPVTREQYEAYVRMGYASAVQLNS